VTNFYNGSDFIENFTIGASDNPNSIVKDEVYPICHFPGANFERRLVFSNQVEFIQSEQNEIEFVNERGDVVFSFDTGNIQPGGQVIAKSININIPSTDVSTQTIGVRFVTRGGAFQVNFTGQIVVFDATQTVAFG